MFIESVFAQGAAPATPAQPGFGSMLVPFMLTLVIMYFLMIRPQQKKQKAHQEALEKLQPGEHVITNSGIFGKIQKIAENVVTLEVANNVRIRILKSQIAGKAESEQTQS